MKTLAYLLPIAAASLIGCSSEPGSVEDAPNDIFYTDDSKADAFGVEDWSPDGAAVLKFTSTATKAQLQASGLTARVAKAIVEKRATMPDRKFGTLAQLDAAPYVGATVFNRLLAYAAEAKLFKTAIRIPLIAHNEESEEVALTSFNVAARAAGVSGFAKYTFVQADTKFDDKMYAYNTRLAELAEKSGTPTGEMMMYASSLDSCSVGSLHACYIGDGGEVSNIAAGHSDEMMSDMYITWGSRFRDDKWVDDSIDESPWDLEDAWQDYDTDSNEVLILSSATDGGDSWDEVYVPPCR